LALEKMKQNENPRSFLECPREMFLCLRLLGPFILDVYCQLLIVCLMRTKKDIINKTRAYGTLLLFCECKGLNGWTWWS